MSATASRVWPGRPYPLGASWDGRGVNFALFSAHAEKVELCLFNKSGWREMERIELRENTHQIWHAYLPDLRPGALYGYRVYGPWEPERGHRFNPNKLLVDPYARMLRGGLRIGDVHYGYRLNSDQLDLSFDRRDSARRMPKCVVVDASFDWGTDRAPRRPWQQTVLYELHPRGMTMLHEGMAPALRGTFAGLSSPQVVDYLVRLGVTAVELMPSHAFVQDRFLAEKGLWNYWGYNSLCFFAPEPRYMSRPLLGEFKTMVRVLHDAGLEVILDVVYNHTAEGDHLGPTLSFRGIDNASYYRLQPGDARYYVDDTGCGNTLNLSHPRVLQMVMDSLRYWVTEMRVDGFRFDLAVALGREQQGYDPGSGFFDAVGQDPVLASVKLTGEPWDVGPGGYHLGNLPPAFGEWNDRFRDTVRRFWRGDRHMLPGLAQVLHGSSEQFEHSGRSPSSSINGVAFHDGYTLADLVSYEQRHNEANGEGNRDGHRANFSCNYGTEGPSTDSTIEALRQRQRRNLLATVFLARGTPLLLAGDELGRTQLGNNNAYCQDNELTWFPWSNAAGPEGEFLAFTRRLIELRRQQPTLSRARFLHGRESSQLTGFKDLAWYDSDGTSMSEEAWSRPDAGCLGWLLSGDVGCETGADGKPAVGDTLFMIFNAENRPKWFKLPGMPGLGHWRWLIGTDRPEQEAGRYQVPTGLKWEVGERSLTVFSLALAHTENGRAGG